VFIQPAEKELPLKLSPKIKMATEIIHLVGTLLVALLLCFVGSSFCAPAIDEETVYDQRQNGTENLILRINDIVFVHAPLEILVALTSTSDETALQQLGTTSSTSVTDLVDPLTESTSAANTTIEDKPKQGIQKTHTKSK
jgi:hypothetical protein